MPFMVIYRNADGSAGYEQVDAIDGAAHFVERLRNDESIDQIRLFRLEEISFAFRPYYKVELGLSQRTTDGAANAVATPTDGNATTTGATVATGSPRLGLFQR